MGRKWLSAVKKLFSVEPKENNGEKPNRKWGKSKDSARVGSGFYEESASPSLNLSLREAEKGQTKHARSVAMATAVAAEAAAVAARAAAEVVRLTTSFKLTNGMSREVVAATKIQAAFRGYLARRRSGALRGLVRLRLLSNSVAVKRQTTNTLHCLQTLARVQSQVRDRRLILSEENHALDKQRQLRREKELEQSKLGEDWDDSPQSKEQLEAKVLKRQEAALRRERSLAYAYSHQWRSRTARSKSATFIDPTTQQWSWSWLDRWMASRPWENSRGVTGRDYFSDRSSIKSGGWSTSVASCRASRPPNRAVPSSCPSEQHRRRHSICGSFFRDEDDHASLHARTKSRLQAIDDGKTKAKAGSLAWKQKSFPGTGVNKKPMPAAATARRLSMPPKASRNVTGMW